MSSLNPSRGDPPVAGEYLPTAEIAFASITIAFLLIRLIGRGFILKTPGFDDLFVTLAFLFAVAFTVSHILAVKWGWGRHVSDLVLSDTRRMLAAEYVQNWTFLIGEMFTRLSVLCFYLRFSDAEHRDFRYLVFAAMAFVAAWSVALSLVNIFACKPVRAFWDIHSLETTQIIRSEGCLSLDQFRSIMFAQAGLDIASDVIVVLLPIRTIWKFRSTSAQKVLMGALLFLGFFVCVAAMIRFRILVDFLNKADRTWNGYEMFLWLSIKLYLSIVCACLLFARPVFVALSRPLSDCYHFLRSSSSHSSSSSSPNRENKEDVPPSSATLAGFHIDNSNRNSALKEIERGESPTQMKPVNEQDPHTAAVDLDDEHYGVHTPYFGEKRYSMRDSREVNPEQVPLPLSPSQLSIDVLPPPSPTTPKGLSPPPPRRSPSQLTTRSQALSAITSSDRERERTGSQDTTAGTMFTSEPPSRMSFRSSFIGVSIPQTANDVYDHDRRGSTVSAMSRRRSSEALPENDRIPHKRDTQSSFQSSVINTSVSTISPIDRISPTDRLPRSNRASMNNNSGNSPVERSSGSSGPFAFDRGSSGPFAFERGSIGRNNSLRSSLYQPSVGKRRSSDALPESERGNSIIGSAKDLREGVYSARGSMYQPTLSTRRSSDALPESERVGGGPAGRDGLYSARGSMYQPTLSTRRSSEALPENERVGSGISAALRDGLYSARGSMHQPGSLSPRRSSEALPENERIVASSSGSTVREGMHSARASIQSPSLQLRRSSDALPSGEGLRLTR